jgi:uncharacterized protein
VAAGHKLGREAAVAYPAEEKTMAHSHPSTAAALPVGERYPVLDILRGFALLGILIMNMPGFGSSFFAEADGSFLWKEPVDRFAEQAREMLFSGKFNSLFSLLFGVGFTIQYTRMKERDPTQAEWLYLRRLAVLFAFGVLHAVLLWPGDVLHSYALLGLVLLFVLRKASDRTVVILAVLCLLYPVVSGLIRLQVMTPDVVKARVAIAQTFEASTNLAYGRGSILDMVAQNARVMQHFYFGSWWEVWGQFGWYVQLLLTMLIGLLAGRRRWVERIDELMPQIRRLTWITLAIGVGCGIVYTTIFELNRTPGPSPIKLLGSICYWTARPALMIFYALLIVRASVHPLGQRWLAPVGLAGRMPLTNYLMQTLIGITLFQGWGFGLWMTVGPAGMLALAIAIFVFVQLPFSRWWLARHERGPMEALWARLTYGHPAAIPDPQHRPHAAH